MAVNDQDSEHSTEIPGSAKPGFPGKLSLDKIVLQSPAARAQYDGCRLFQAERALTLAQEDDLTVHCLRIAGIILTVIASIVASQAVPAVGADEPARAPAPATRASRIGPVLVWWNSDGTTLSVVESGPQRLATVDVHSGRVDAGRDLPLVGDAPARFLTISPDGAWSARIDPWQSRVIISSTRDGAGASRTITVSANPQALVATPDSKRLLIACDAAGLRDRELNIVDIDSGAVTRCPIRGSSNLRGMAVDPAGRFALVVHLVPKFHLPSTQIEQGWVFTNAVSHVSLDGSHRVVTLPLDLRTQAFANPEGITVTPDGARAYVAHAGADLVSVIDLPEFLKVVTGHAGATGPVEDLRLTRRYVRTRMTVGHNPRGIAVSPDGRTVAVANRLSDSISLIDATTNTVTRTISLAPPHEWHDRSLADRGEILFHSGRLSFSGQFSCASCHPDGHSDGLNWDLPADGFNNFHNTKSLLAIDGTAPYGWLGTSPTLKDRFAGTLRHLFQHEPLSDELDAIDSYLSQLKYPTLPRRKDETPEVMRGRELFHGIGGCTACHSGSKLTDRAVHDIGTGVPNSLAFDTPSLIHISETAPYLHDGRANTLEEIFVRHNSARLHGEAHRLSAQQLADLIAYLKSL